jgi:DNA-directed RNA polymerase II subunit RPB2
MTSRINTDDEGRRVAKDIIHKYFTTQSYPYTKHHIDSYDQFLSTDLISILKSNNPIRIYKDIIPSKDTREKLNYRYNIELYVGGKNGDKVQVGTPVVNLDQSTDVRVLFPNEARLRNLTYESDIKVDIDVDLTIKDELADGTLQANKPIELHFEGINLFTLPIMLHSRYCLLHNKPKDFLIQAGECPFDNGGYFIIDGSEKVLVSRQESAFNTFFITKRTKGVEADKVSIDGYVTSLNPETRSVSSTSFAIDRSTQIIYATLPMIRAPINIFIVFRALGIQTDEDIVRMIFPDPKSADAQFLQDKLIPSIINAYPFLTKTVAIQYLKTLTKGFTEATVLDVLQNRLFTHIPNSPGARATYLAECIRSLLRVEHGFELQPSRDDARNQRCLNSGFLIQDMFNSIYKDWKTMIRKAIDEEYAYHEAVYKGQNFVNIFF